MIDLVERIRRDEQMDDPALDPKVYDAVLRDLARVNAWTFAARPTLGFLKRASRGMPAFRLLDVGFGQGDMLRRIARWARRRGQAVDPAAIRADIEARDHRDMNRAVAPLKQASDAHLLDTTHLGIDAAVRAAIDIVEAVRAGRRPA